jgi:hypothetical protein
MKLRRLKARRELLGAALVGTGLLLGAFGVRQTLAVGIPAQAALSYSGLLQDADGQPLSGEHVIELELWNVANGAGEALCSTAGVSTALSNGRFSVPLPEECAATVQTHADLWFEVIVDGTALGRNKIGAVPYAVEANRASVAGGALEASLAALEARLADLEAQNGALVARLALLEARKVASGSVGFTDGACELPTEPCAIDISSAGFQSPPQCTITLRNPDASGYTEHMVVQSATEVELRVWRGQFYQKNGTNMLVQYICVGE